MSTRLEALGNLKASLAPTPLWVYLYIYTKADRECYLNYMEGAKALARWLGKIEVPADTSDIEIPSLLCNYETQELEAITGASQDIIVSTLIEEVIPRMIGDLTNEPKATVCTTNTFSTSSL